MSFLSFSVILSFFLCSVSFADQSPGIGYLNSIMSSNGTANITQESSEIDGKEEGKLYWNSAKKCIRVEMKSGVVYLYTEGGMHMKENGKSWVHVPLPNEWSRMLLEPEAVIKEKDAKIQKINDDTYGLHLEEGGRFIYLFWTKNQLKGWIVGTMEHGAPHNEISVDLEKVPNIKLPESCWAPGSSFLGGDLS